MSEDAMIKAAHPMYAAFCRDDEEEAEPRRLEDLADEAFERENGR